MIRRAGADWLYVTSGLPVGLAWLIVLVVAIAVGVGTSVVMIGIALLALTLLLIHWGANTERDRAALVLGAPIQRPPRPSPRPGRGGPIESWRARLADRATWKEVGYMLLLGPVGMATATVVVSLWSLVIASLAAAGFSSMAPSQSWLGSVSPLGFVGLALGAVVLAGVTLGATYGLARAWAALATALLAPDERAILAARVQALEQTRAGAVESADARLRRLERDLHDGAQHRLAFIAMELDRARARLAEDPEAAGEFLTRAHEESKKAMGELRDLVRGIHPSVLIDRGLDAAISGLAERCPVPVDVTVGLSSRLATGTETAAYYVVAEALTNVGKHAGASRAAVSVHQNSQRLVIEVHDDGRGGAVRTPGSGLEGLAQRVEALDGTLTLDSPAGGPTTITAELPCAS